MHLAPISSMALIYMYFLCRFMCHHRTRSVILHFDHTCMYVLLYLLNTFQQMSIIEDAEARFDDILRSKIDCWGHGVFPKDRFLFLTGKRHLILLLPVYLYTYILSYSLQYMLIGIYMYGKLLKLQ